MRSPEGPEMRQRNRPDSSHACAIKGEQAPAGGTFVTKDEQTPTGDIFVTKGEQTPTGGSLTHVRAPTA